MLISVRPLFFLFFKANSISFLAGNNFDFNKLFNKSISYARLSESETVRQQCVYRVTKVFPSERQFTCLSPNHDKTLKELMEKVEVFVYDATS